MAEYKEPEGNELLSRRVLVSNLPGVFDIVQLMRHIPATLSGEILGVLPEAGYIPETGEVTTVACFEMAAPKSAQLLHLILLKGDCRLLDLAQNETGRRNAARPITFKNERGGTRPIHVAIIATVSSDPSHEDKFFLASAMTRAVRVDGVQPLDLRKVRRRAFAHACLVLTDNAEIINSDSEDEDDNELSTLWIEFPSIHKAYGFCLWLRNQMRDRRRSGRSGPEDLHHPPYLRPPHVENNAVSFAVSNWGGASASEVWFVEPFIGHPPDKFPVGVLPGKSANGMYRDCAGRVLFAPMSRIDGYWLYRPSSVARAHPHGHSTEFRGPHRPLPENAARRAGLVGEAIGEAEARPVGPAGPAGPEHVAGLPAAAGSADFAGPEHVAGSPVGPTGVAGNDAGPAVADPAEAAPEFVHPPAGPSTDPADEGDGSLWDWLSELEGNTAGG